MTQYAVIIEKGESSYGAYVPDLPGCVAVADTRAEVERLINEAVLVHLEALQSRGEAVPRPTSSAAEVDVSV